MSDISCKLTLTEVIQLMFFDPRQTVKKSLMVVKITIKAANNSPCEYVPVQNQKQKQWKKLEVNNIFKVTNKDTRTTSKRCEILMSF